MLIYERSFAARKNSGAYPHVAACAKTFGMEMYRLKHLETGKYHPVPLLFEYISDAVDYAHGTLYSPVLTTDYSTLTPVYGR